jgi:hypothetical protein
MLGNYVLWNTKENVEVISASWLKGQKVEGIPEEYEFEKIECMFQGVRDYCKYYKARPRAHQPPCLHRHTQRRYGQGDGHGASAGVRRQTPRSLDHFLKILGITEDEFVDILVENEVKNWGFDRNGWKKASRCRIWRCGIKRYDYGKEIVGKT